MYHDAPGFEDLFDRRVTRYRREAIFFTLAVLLGLGVMAGVGTGAAALVTQHQGFLIRQLLMKILETYKILSWL